MRWRHCICLPERFIEIAVKHRSLDGKKWTLINPGCRSQQSLLIAKGHPSGGKQGTIQYKCERTSDCYGAELCVEKTCKTCFVRVTLFLQLRDQKLSGLIGTVYDTHGSEELCSNVCFGVLLHIICTLVCGAPVLAHLLMLCVLALFAKNRRVQYVESARAARINRAWRLHVRLRRLRVPSV